MYKMENIDRLKDIYLISCGSSVSSPRLIVKSLALLKDRFLTKKENKNIYGKFLFRNRESIDG